MACSGFLFNKFFLVFLPGTTHFAFFLWPVRDVFQKGPDFSSGFETLGIAVLFS